MERPVELHGIEPRRLDLASLTIQGLHISTAEVITRNRNNVGAILPCRCMQRQQ